MSADSAAPEDNGATKRIKLPTPIWAATVISVLLLASIFRPTRTLEFGWILFLMRVVPKVQVNWMLVGIGIGSFTGIVLIIHHLGRWFTNSNVSDNGNGSGWQFRSSVCVGLLIVTMFCAGLAAVGVTHQAVWLIRSPNDWMVQKIGGRVYQSEDYAVEYKLKSLDLGLNLYGDQNKRLPFSPDDDDGVRLSWPSRIIGYMYSLQKAPRRTNVSWDDEQNREYYSRIFPDLLSPALENAPQHNEDGYGVSHFEANENIQGYSYDDFRSGASQTIMIGEVNMSFEPWGKPDTFRNLDLGLNRHPDGFGGPLSRDSVMFLMLDGSVRQINDTVDPKVLRSMSGNTADVDSPR